VSAVSTTIRLINTDGSGYELPVDRFIGTEPQAIAFENRFYVRVGVSWTFTEVLCWVFRKNPPATGVN
jgi:hypothetical protein